MEKNIDSIVGTIDQGSDSEKIAWNQLKDEEFKRLEGLEFVQQGGLLRKTGLNKDPEFMIRAIKLRDALMADAAPSLMHDRDFLEKALDEFPSCYRFLPEDLRKDKALALRALQKGATIGESFPAELLKDLVFLEDVISKNPSAILDVWELFPGDSPEFMISILKKYPQASISLIHEFQENHDTSGRGHFESLYGFNMLDIVKFPELNSNPDFMLDLLKIRPFYFDYVPVELIADRDFLIRVLTTIPYIDRKQYSHEVFQDEDILFAGIERRPEIIRALDRSHFTPEFIDAVASKVPESRYFLIESRLIKDDEALED